MSDSYPVAADLGVAGCECCGLVLAATGGAGAWRCPRCGFALYTRKPHSVQRTVA